MRKLFLMFFLFVLLGRSPVAYCQKILLPLPPKQTKPPLLDETPRLKIKEKNKRKTYRPKKIKESFHKKNQKNEIEKLQSKEVLKYSLTLNLSYNKIKTNGKRRRNYTAEPGVILKGDYSLGSSSTKTSGFSNWLGLRIANFSGSGVFDDLFFRYSYMAIGPSYSLKWLENSTENSSQSLTKGVVFSLGISKISSEIKTQLTGETSDKSSSSGTKHSWLNATGFWFEISFLKFQNNAFSRNYMVGIQLDADRTFYYIAIGVDGYI